MDCYHKPFLMLTSAVDVKKLQYWMTANPKSSTVRTYMFQYIIANSLALTGSHIYTHTEFCVHIHFGAAYTQIPPMYLFIGDNVAWCNAAF